MPPFSKNSTPFWSMGKCLLGAALVLCTSLTFHPSVQAEVTSEDLLVVNGGNFPANHWAAESIRLAVDKYQILSGYADKTIRGDRTVTRYELAALLYQWAQWTEQAKIPLQGQRVGKAYDNMLYENGGNLHNTQELLKALQKKGMEIENVDKEVRKNVRKLSGGKQIPWQTSNLESNFIMHP